MAPKIKYLPLNSIPGTHVNVGDHQLRVYYDAHRQTDIQTHTYTNKCLIPAHRWQRQLIGSLWVRGQPELHSENAVCFFFNPVSMCMSMWGHAHMSADALKGQKRMLDLLVLELQLTVSSPLRKLGTKTKSRSSERAVGTPNGWAIPPVTAASVVGTECC